MSQRESVDIAILGGGISGLTVAWYLQKSLGDNARILLCEKENRLGGWIRTDHEQGFLFERGPRSLRISAANPTLFELIKTLSLESELITDAPAAQLRYLWNGNSLEKVPSSFWELLTSPLTRDLLITGLMEWFRPKGVQMDESVLEFISRRYSPEVAQRLVDPLFSGIYAGDISKLSAQVCLKEFWEYEKKRGSILWGMLSRKKRKQLAPPKSLEGHSLFTLRNGLESLVLRLGSEIKRLRLGCEIVQCQKDPSGFLLSCKNGSLIEAGRVISALPTYALATLFEKSDPKIAQELNTFTYESISAVHLGWHNNILPCEGFGYLIASRVKEEVLGVVFDSSAFPIQNGGKDQTRLTVMIGGSHRPELAYMEKMGCVDIAIRSIHRHLGISQRPDAIAVTYATKAIPSYCIGHTDKVKNLNHAFDMRWKQFSLIGPIFDGVSLTTCIERAKSLANSIVSTDSIFAKKRGAT